MQKNRNSLRSIQLIKGAFLEILQEKDISKITVKEVADLANLTRNTFYAHFIDIYEVNEAIENEVIDKTILLMDKLSSEDLFDNTLIFFKKTMSYIATDKTKYKAILEHGTSASFILNYSTRLIDHVMNNLSSIKVNDKVGFRTFLNILFTGSVFLVKKYLLNESEITVDEIAISLNNIFVNCYKLYI